ncbi:MAG: 30S ribosomal protein THX [Bacteroidota bacterium]
MGKGDKRTTKGKINISSYGKSRDKKTNRPRPHVKAEKSNV